MKKVVVIVLVLLAVAVAAVAVFLATFDLNRYTKALSSRIEAVVGNPVELGRLSLAWKGAIVLEVDTFRILSREGAAGQAAFSFDRASMVVDPAALLKKQLKISSLTVTGPRIHVVRAKDGAISVRGYSPKGPSPAAAPPPAASAAAAIDFTVSSVAIRDGILRFQDLSGQQPVDITIDAIDADIKDISLTTPMRFAVKMALLAARQNVDVSGVAGGFAAGPLYVKDLDARLDLASLDYGKLVRAVPAVRALGISEGLKGLLTAKVNELRIAGGKVEKAAAEITLTGGRVPLAQLKVPVDTIALSASLADDTLSVGSFSARLANATLKSSANVTGLFAVPQTTLRLEAEIPRVKDFAVSLLGGRQYLDGAVALQIDAAMSGASQESIVRTLSGRGTFTLNDGVLVDANFIAEALGALSLFPGLNEKIKAYLPPATIDILSRPYTALKPVRQSIVIRDGAVTLPDITVGMDLATVRGAARMSLAGELAGSGVIELSPVLSEGIVKAVPAMKYLAGPRDTIEFPVAFKADRGGFAVMPDLQYVATRAAMKKGEELMSDLLQKAMKPKEGAKP